MLEVEELHAHYGNSHVLHGVSFSVAAGEIVALLGRNGAGRSTTAKAIMGLVTARGRVDWRGRALSALPPFERARLGLGYVPENRDVFPRLTVEQNLVLGLKPGRSTAGWRLEDMYALFPPLWARRRVLAGVLSGGEQQMLTLCRTLMGNPELLIIDEPTEGLAPQVVQQVAQCLQTLRQRGLSVLLVEQKLAIALEVSDRALVMGHGRVVFDDTPAALAQDAAVRREWLEV
jgi:branched-chain amino acid transport system ATP-binding protein